MRKRRIGLVTAYPPTQGRLSEYGWHLAEQLRANPRVGQVIVLADRVPGAGATEAGRLAVDRCWTFDGFDFALNVARAAVRHRLDALWFNIHLTSTGRRRATRACALAAPAALRLLGYPTVVTLHHLPDLTDLAAASIRASALDRLGGRAVVRLLGHASRICVPLPEYAALLRRRYGIRRAAFRPLGAPGLPPLADVRRDPRALLAFGRFGSYKRLEVVLEAVDRLHRSASPVHLHIAGSDSIYSPGYLASLAAAFDGHPGITFHGYVPECSIPALFQRCALALLPYRTITGASSVAMQAALYGTGIVAADIPGLRLTRNLGVEMTFGNFDDPAVLAWTLERCLRDNAARDVQVRHNLEYSRSVQMQTVVDGYLDEIDAVDRAGYRGRITVEMTSSVRS